MSGIKLEHIYNPGEDDFGPNAYEFLNRLGGPTVIHIDGQDSTKCRVLVTLLHGNEPSGLKALHKLIRHQVKPATSFKVIVASVVAARTEPVFNHRMLPGQRDLNRCFSDEKMDLQGQLAKAIAEQVREFSPEAIIDLHNTSGSGPAFCVSVSERDEYIALASHFTRRIIHTDIRLGSIMEQDFGCPIVTVEAGGAQDLEADQNAFCGLHSFVMAKSLFELQEEMEVLRHPRRLEILPASSIAFDSKANLNNDITICQDVEKLNFGITQSSQMLGWVNEQGLQNFKLDDDALNVDAYFEIDAGRLVTKRPLKLFMVTTRADIAKSDCLFYFVETEDLLN